jgi:type VI secretion system protein ImpF
VAKRASTERIERTAQPSVLDRLVDLDPRVTSDTPVTLAQSMRLVKEAVRRDLEWLLNTRRTPIVVPSSLPETTRSVFNYGLPDLTSFSYEGGDDRARLLRGVEDIVALFEPRLAGARVAMVETTGEGTHQKELRFVIEGTLRVEPTPERVAFDTVIEMGSGECRVGDRRVDTTNG